MSMYTSTVKNYISLEMEFQKNILDPSRKKYVMDQGKYRKWASQRHWTEREYHVQDKQYVSQTSVKISCATTQFLGFLFCGLHIIPHGLQDLIKYYHL